MQWYALRNTHGTTQTGTAPLPVPFVHSLGDGWAARSLGGEGDQDFDASDGSLWKYVAANFTAQERQKMRITFHGTTSSVKVTGVQRVAEEQSL